MRFRHLLPLLVLAVGACADGPSQPTAISDRLANTGTEQNPTNSFLLCKSGSAASFSYSVAGRSAQQVDLADGECRYIHTWDGAPGEFQLVSVTELNAAGLDSIVKDSINDFDPIRLPTITGTATVTGIVYHSKGVVAHFYNSDTPPPSATQGCTPGYWKQPQHFDSWPAQFQPGMQFSSVFADAFPGKTLLNVLSAGGGGLNALGRHTVAALLNAGNAGVNSGLTTADVIAAFNAAYASGSYESQKNVFERLNELGCPLN